MASRLLIDEPPLLVSPKLAELVGLEASIILQQVHYLTNPATSQTSFEGRYWVWKTYDQWGDMLPFLSKRTLQRVIKSLEENELLIVKKRQNRSFKHVKFYAVNYEALTNLLENSQESHKPPPLSQNTSCGEELANTDIRPCQKSPDLDTGPASSSPEEVSSSDLLPPQEEELLSSPLTSKKRRQTMTFSKRRQNGTFDDAKMARRDGQVDHVQVAKLATSYKEDKTTGKDYTHPLSPSQEKLFVHRNAEKREENVFLKKKFGDARPSRDQRDGEVVFQASPMDGAEDHTRKGTFFPNENQEVHSFQNLRRRSDRHDISKVLTQSMIDLWNRSVQKALEKQPVMVTRRREHRLLEILEDLFEGDLARWQAYCDRLTRYRFLMGENESGFKVTLDWALNPDNAVKVLESALYDKSPFKGEKSSSAKKDEEEGFFYYLEQDCFDVSADPSWFLFCKQLAQSMGLGAYKAWFKGVVPLEFEASEVVLGVPNALTKERLERDWIPALHKALEAIFSDIPDLTLQDLRRRKSHDAR